MENVLPWGDILEIQGFIVLFVPIFVINLKTARSSAQETLRHKARYTESLNETFFVQLDSPVALVVELRAKNPTGHAINNETRIFYPAEIADLIKTFKPRNIAPLFSWHGRQFFQ